MVENVGVGALELRNDVPTLARATLYNVLEVGQDTTGAVIGAVLYEGEESRHLVVGEGDKMLHKVAHNPFEGGFVALDYDMLIDVLHKAKNYRVKLLKIRGLKIHCTSIVSNEMSYFTPSRVYWRNRYSAL